MIETDVDRFSPLAVRRAFTNWAVDRLRFGDTDKLGHVNNVVYATACESGRVGFLGNPVEGADFALVRFLINYRKEVFYPGDIETGTCLLKLGKTSVTMGHGLFQGETCIATAESVCVLMDLESRQPISIPRDTQVNWVSSEKQ